MPSELKKDEVWGGENISRVLTGLMGYMALALYTNDNLFFVRDIIGLANGTLGTP